MYNFLEYALIKHGQNIVLYVLIYSGEWKKEEQRRIGVGFFISLIIWGLLQCHIRRHTFRIPFCTIDFYGGDSEEDLRPRRMHLGIKMKSF
jgi:hypothetical protein